MSNFSLFHATTSSFTAVTDIHIETEPKPETLPELTPDWPKALDMWGKWWPLHMYLTATLFASILIFAVTNAILLCISAELKKLHTRWYFLNLNILLIFLGVFRSLYFYLDPYNFRGILPQVLSFILINLPFPCLTSGYILLLITFVQVTKMQITNPGLIKPRLILVIIVFNFLITFTVDIITAVLLEAWIIALLCSIFFAIWGIILACSYIHIVLKLFKSSISIRRKENTRRYNVSENNIVTSKNHPKASTRVKRSIQVTLGIAVVFMVWSLLNVYGAAVVYQGRETATPPPWPWFALQSGLRLCEVALGLLVLYISSQPTLSLIYKDKLEGSASPQLKQPGNSTNATSGDIYLQTTARTNV